MHLVCPACFAVNRVPDDRLAEQPKCGRCGGAVLDPRPVSLTTADFDVFIGRSDLPVVVDFWAAWCGPCRIMAPVFEQVARQFSTRVRFAKVDTESQPMLARRFGIRSIPGLLLFRNGAETDRIAGALDVHALTNWLQRQR
jgi:thioredoxin 2